MDKEAYNARTRYRGRSAETYLQYRNTRWIWQREQQALAQLVARFERGTLVLDVAVGTARYLEYYARRELQVIGCDISLDMLAQAFKTGTAMNYPLSLVQGDAEHIPLQDGAVDYVVCTRLLNKFSLPTLARVVAEFARVTRLGIVVGIWSAEEIRWQTSLRGAVTEIFSSPGLVLKEHWRTWRRHRLGLAARLKGGSRNDFRYGSSEIPHESFGISDTFVANRLTIRDSILINRGLVYTHQPLHARTYQIYFLEHTKSQ